MRLSTLAFLSSFTAALDTSPDHYVWPNHCCFSLRDSSTSDIVQQSKDYFLFVGSNRPTGWYCINPNDTLKCLRDPAYSACYTDPEKRIRCLDATPPGDQWSLTKKGDNVYLTLDARTDFVVCPKLGAGQIFSNQLENQSKCGKVELQAWGFKEDNDACKAFEIPI